MKRVVLSFGVICLLLLAVFGFNYANNERKIKKFNNGEYEKNGFDILGFTEPYINDYNQGNIYYMQNQYEDAYASYEAALKKHPTHDRECQIRINMALCLVEGIDVDSITKDNVDQVIDTLHKAKKLLTDHGCANIADDNGHNKDATTLRKEIDEFEKSLLSDSGEDNSQGEDPKDNEEQEKQETKPVSDLDKKKEELQKLQEESIKVHFQDGAEIESILDDSPSVFGGESW